MAFLDRFRTQPEWKNPDPAVRLGAVRKLRAEDGELLAAIARGDADPGVRRAAVRRIADPAVLASVLREDADEGTRDEAGERLTALAVEGADAGAATVALQALTDPKHLVTVARDAASADVRRAALGRLTTPRAVATVARGAADPATRLEALALVQDPAVLADLAAKSEHKDVALAAVERVTDPKELSRIAARAKSRAAARRARALLAAQAPAAAPGAVPAPPPVPAPDPAAETAAAASLAEREARETAEQAEAERIQAERSARLAERSDLVSRVEALAGEVIPQGVEEAKAAWAALPPAEGAEEVDGRFEEACAAALRRHQARSTEEGRRARLEALCAELEALVAQPEAPDGRARARRAGHEWNDLASGFAVEAALAERQAAAVAALEARESLARQEREKREKDNLERRQALCARLEALVAAPEPSLRELDQALRESKAAVDDLGPLPSRRDREALTSRLKAARQALYPRLQERREADDWKRWANLGVQEELAKKAEALLEVKDVAEAANRLRELEEQWKAAREVPRDQGQALWERFRKARDEVRGRAESHFSELKSQREENLKRKLELCERAEALAESTEWLQTAEKIKQLQGEWQKVGAVPRARSEEVWQRFRTACDRFFERRKADLDQRKGEWAANLARKEALCAQAEALMESTDWARAAAEIRKLQQEWKAVGPVRKNRSEAVWQRFRKACDHFFERYKHRGAKDASAAATAREAIVAELEGLLPEGEVGPGDEPPGLAVKVQVAQASWAQAPALGKERLAPLQRRLDEAVARLVKAWPDAFRGTDLDAEATRKRMEALCARAEELAAQVEPARPQDPLALVAQLREALASNTMRGRGGEGGRSKEAERELESLREAWRQLGPVPDEAAEPLVQRFRKACSRVLGQKQS